MKDLIRQYHEQGVDLTEAADFINALSSTGKTPLGLNRWQRSDKPVMDDFNEDNRIIDENLRGLWEKKADKKRPEARSLPFADTLEGYLYYSRSDDGLVMVDMRLKAKDTAGVPNRTMFAQLPEGFRPERGVYTEVVMYKKGNSSDFHGGYVVIDPDGKMYPDTYSGGVTATEWNGTLWFYARQAEL